MKETSSMHTREYDVVGVLGFFGLCATLLGTPPTRWGREGELRGELSEVTADECMSMAQVGTRFEDKSAWKIREGEAATERARAILGDPQVKSSNIQAGLEVLKDDSTPYLSRDIIDRPLWHITIDDWSVKLPCFHEGVKDRFVRTLDVYVDPVDGKLLKLETRWPAEEPPIGPPPSAETAVRQMKRSDNHVYHGFPEASPQVTFVEALNSIVEHAGAQPTVARQIIGHYVVWSTTSREPRPVWAITLRGIPPYFLGPPATTNEPRFQLRYIVDATTGKYIRSSNVPGAVEPNPRGD